MSNRLLRREEEESLGQNMATEIQIKRSGCAQRFFCTASKKKKRLNNLTINRDKNDGEALGSELRSSMLSN